MSAFGIKRGLGRLEVLTRDQRRDVHEQSLHLLESMGMKIYSDEALEILRKNGADVDTKAKIAHIPRSLVEEGLRRCMRPVKLGGRTPDCDFVMDHEHHFLSTDGEGIAVLDFESRAQ